MARRRASGGSRLPLPPLTSLNASILTTKPCHLELFTHRVSIRARRDHDTEEEAARAFDRAAINKAGPAAATNYPITDYAKEMESLQKVSVSELVATLRAKARRHGTQTSQYRGVSLLKQTGKWHGQINVGGKQLHLGFFATEELAARAYDRAAIHKASTEGGVIVTNLDISEYARDIEKLQRMTRKELLAMIADEKKQAQNRADSVQNDDSDGSNGGSGSGSGTDAPSASRRSNKTFGRQSNRSSASQLTHVGSLPSVRDGSNSPTNQEGGGSHEAADTSSGEKSGFETVKLPPARLAAQEEMSKKSPQPAAGGSRAREDPGQGGQQKGHRGGDHAPALPQEQAQADQDGAVACARPRGFRGVRFPSHGVSCTQCISDDFRRYYERATRRAMQGRDASSLEPERFELTVLIVT